MSISPILFSGVKEDFHQTKQASFLDGVCHVTKRAKGIKTPFKIALQAFEWAKWMPFNQPVLSLISQGRTLVKLCRPSSRPLKIFARAISLWRQGTGVGQSTFTLGKEFIQKGWDRVQLRKVYVVVKNFFAWTLGMVSWTCRAILLVSNEFLSSIASRLPDLIFKVGMISTAPLLGVSLISQTGEFVNRKKAAQPTNLLLQEARHSANKVISLSLMSTIFKCASFCLSAIAVFSLAAVPVLIPLSFSTVGLTSSVAALYEGKKGHLESHHIRGLV